jgi:hypothetical protein
LQHTFIQVSTDIVVPPRRSQVRLASLIPLAINSTYYGLGGTYMHFLRANSTSVTPHKTGGKRIGTGRTRVYLGGDGS